MASPGELVRCVSAVLGVPEATVVQHDRNLAEAGKRTMGGRGNSAARMTSADAANLLIATAAGSQARDSLLALTEHADLKLYPYEQRAWTRRAKRKSSAISTVEQFRILAADHRFVDMLSALIDAAQGQDLIEALRRKQRSAPRTHVELVEVSFFSPFPGCQVRLGNANTAEFFSYGQGSSQQPDLFENTLEDIEAQRAAAPDLKQERSFTAKTIFAVADCLNA